MIGHYIFIKAFNPELQNNPRAFFLPCSAYSLNLVFRNSVKSSTVAIIFFSFLDKIFNLFSVSNFSAIKCFNNNNMLKGLIIFLEKYRENGFDVAMETAKQLVISIKIKPMFKKVCFKKFLL